MSNRIYTPDKWTMIKIATDNTTIIKVMGSWYGGFTQGDSWRLSSGATEITEEGDFFKVRNHSGSTYMCAKHAEGISGFSAGILAQIREQYPGVTIEEITMEQARAELQAG